MNTITVLYPTVPVLSKSTKNVIKRFPVHRIYCVGRNYRDHAIEMGGNPDREPPFFFQKPSDAIVDTYKETEMDKTCFVPYPTKTSSLHHEAELVVAIGKDGLNIQTEDAKDHIFGYAIGCDLTRRDLQSEAKRSGRPWCCSKGFDFSAPCSAIVPKEETVLHTATCNIPTDSTYSSASATIELEVNNSIRQSSTLDKMTWTVPEIISYLSGYFRLRQGDLIMTGTPDGVNSIDVHDKVTISCGDLPKCEFTISEEEEDA